MPRITPRSRRAGLAAGASILLLAAACEGRTATDEPSSAPSEPAVIDAFPTQAAVVDLDTTSMIAVSDGQAHPLESVMASPGQRVLWSPDGSLMTINTGGGFWEWTGPDSDDPLFHDCGPGCEGVYTSNDPDRLFALTGTEVQAMPAAPSVEPEPVTADIDTGFTDLWGSVDDKLLVGEASPEDRANASPDVWLVHPFNGGATASAELTGDADDWAETAVLSADRTRLAVAMDGTRENGCPVAGAMTLYDTADLSEAEAVPPVPEGGHGGGTVTWDLFFNGGSLYGVFAELYGDGGACTETAPMGLWRLRDGAWEQVSGGEFYTARPMEALDGTGSESVLIVDAEFDCRVVDLPEGTVRTDLGKCDVGFWSTPTFNEIDLSGIEGM